MYIYGGYEYNSGILQDFYKIRLGDSQTPFECQKIVYGNQELKRSESVQDESEKVERPNRLIKLPRLTHPGK